MCHIATALIVALTVGTIPSDLFAFSGKNSRHYNLPPESAIAPANSLSESSTTFLSVFDGNVSTPELKCITDDCRKAPREGPSCVLGHSPVGLSDMLAARAQRWSRLLCLARQFAAASVSPRTEPGS
jgi:hypothetical protein